jgi:hypothetical protein
MLESCLASFLLSRLRAAKVALICVLTVDAVNINCDMDVNSRYFGLHSF